MTEQQFPSLSVCCDKSFIPTKKFSMAFSAAQPYNCLYIDASSTVMLKMIANSVKWYSEKERESIMTDLKTLWTNPKNNNSVIPCLSVRSGFDLYLRVKNFPPGSEVIMSAINIPDMIKVVKHHNLRIVAWDISLETTCPKLELLERLVTEKTVAIIVSHIYGKWIEMDPIIRMAEIHDLPVIEDCAEVFSGLDKIGHPSSELILFSFGYIKYYTSLGGAIVKVKSQELFDKMNKLYGTYRRQKQTDYMKKIPVLILGCLMNSPTFSQLMMSTLETLNIDRFQFFVSLLRGFPTNMIERIRHQPSTALLSNMRYRHRNFDFNDLNLSRVKGEYLHQKLPESVTVVGRQAKDNNYWLFPIIVENPDNIVKLLNNFGVEAFRGASQLNLVESTNGDPPISPPPDLRYPHEAKYLMDNLVYLPVHKWVPFHILDKISQAVCLAVQMNSKSTNGVRLPSKL